MNTSRAAIVISTIIGKALSIAGYIFGVIAAGTMIISFIDGDIEGVIAVGMVLLLPSLVCIIAGARIKRRIRRFKVYVTLISTGNNSLAELAAHINRPIAFVRKDVVKMINKRYFLNAFMDNVTNTVVINRPIHAFQPYNPVAPTVNHPAHFPHAVHDEYACKGCGATGTKQRGAIITCEYCGSHIK